MSTIENNISVSDDNKPVVEQMLAKKKVGRPKL